MTGGGMLSAILADQPDDMLVDVKRKLEKRIADARTSLAEAEGELRLVEQALAARRPERAAVDSAASRRAETERDRETDGRFQGIPRARILAVATSLPDPITPTHVVEAFAQHGETVNIEQIRIALSRIAKDGNLTKIGPSLFTAPTRRPPEPEPPYPQPAPPPSREAQSPFRGGARGVDVSADVFRRGV